MPEMSAHNAPPVVGRAGIVGEAEQARLMQLAELSVEMDDRGWDPASVVSLHPFRVYTTGVLLRELTLPGVPLDDAGWEKARKIKVGGFEVPYVQHIFTRWEPIILEQVHGFEGNFQGSISRKAILPITLANDVVHQNNNPSTRGGVVAYKGDHPPFLNPDTQGKERDQLEQAFAQQIAFYTRLFEEAESAFSNPNTKLNLWREMQYNRWATRYLRKLGIVPQDPKWLVKTVQAGGQTPQHCISCGAESKPGALRCTNGQCTYVFKPYEAFDSFVIGLDTPGASLAYRRLDADQVAKLIKAGRFTFDQLEAAGFVVPPQKSKQAKEKEAPAANS